MAEKRNIKNGQHHSGNCSQKKQPATVVSKTTALDLADASKYFKPPSGWSSLGLLHMKFGSEFRACISMSCEWFFAKRTVHNNTLESFMTEGINNKGRQRNFGPCWLIWRSNRNEIHGIPNPFCLEKLFRVESNPVDTPPKTNMEPEKSLWKRKNIYKLHQTTNVGFHVSFQGCIPKSKETANHECHYHDPVAFHWLINIVSSSIHFSLYHPLSLYRLYHPLPRCSAIPLSLHPSIHPSFPQKRGCSSNDLAPHLVQKIYRMYYPWLQIAPPLSLTMS